MEHDAPDDSLLVVTDIVTIGGPMPTRSVFRCAFEN